jgi:DNA-binding transcriptional regulator of glucitol operon
VRRVTDDPRRWSWSARFLVTAALLGVVMGGWGMHKADEAQDSLHAYVAGQEAQTDRALFVGCVTGNRDGRFGTRVNADVLADLVERVNANARAAGAELPDEFANAPERLRRVTSRNQNRPCPALYPDGYRLFLAERSPGG